MAQINAKTGKAYEGSNQSTLAAAQGAKGYRSGMWATYLQAKDLGLQVRKGEHGTRIMKLVDVEKVNKATGKLRKDTAVRTYTVFNVDQMDKAIVFTGMPSFSPTLLTDEDGRIND